MKKALFTDTMIRKLKPENIDYCRSEGNGFTIRVMPSGVKTWLYLYTFDGKRRKMNLGHYPDVDLATARSKFEDAKRKVKNGFDPLAEQETIKQERILAPTVSKLIEEYIDKHAKVNKRSWEYDQWLLDQKVLPVWGKRKAQDIKKRDVILLLESLVESGTPAMSNQTLKIVRKMFNFAVERDILQSSPFAGVKALATNATRKRTLAEPEIKIMWDSLTTCAISSDIQRALKMILITAQRPGEVAGMHSAEIDGAWWTIPSERSKNGLAHRVYLTETAKLLIAEQIEATKLAREMPVDKEYSGFIFPTPHLKKVQSIDTHALAVAVRRNLNWPMMDTNGKPVMDQDGKAMTENKMGIDQFTPHDLRRTAATFMSQLGEMDEVIDAVLNHKKQGIIKVYNQNRYDREKQKALESWGRKLASIVSGSAKDNVVSITKAKTKKAQYKTSSKEDGRYQYERL